MDASDGGRNNGNGHSPDPTPVSLPSDLAAPSGAPVPGASTAPEAGVPEPLVVVDDDARDPATGRIRKGKTLNPKGRPPGIVNRNAQLNRGFEAFRANPELCKEALKKYKIKIRGLKAEQLLITLAFAKAIVDKDDSLLKWCGEHAYLSMTPAAAGIVINNNPQANASSSSHNENHADFGELLQHRGTRDAVAELTRQLAASGAFSRGGRLGN